MCDDVPIWQREHKVSLVSSRPVSAGATIGPDRTGLDAHLLEIRESDDGVDGDRRQPATCGAALNRAIDKALAAKAALSRPPGDAA